MTERSGLRYSVSGLSCASCAVRLEKALAEVPGVRSARVNFATAKAVVEADDAVGDAILSAAERAGYPVEPAEEAGRSVGQRENETRDAGQRALVAAVLAVPLVVLEMGGHLSPGFHHWIGEVIGHQNSRVIQFVLTLLVLAGPGRQIYAKGYPALFRGAPDMNSLVALGTTAAFVHSVLATFAPGLMPQSGQAVYFEAAAVVVTLILVGRYFEARAKGRAGEAITKLLSLAPDTAQVVEGDRVVETPVERIVPGDVLVVRPGERVAVDGVVVSGASHVDESMISGEPAPVRKEADDAVTAGTVNTTGNFRYRATRVGADTTLAGIIRMVESAQETRLPIQGVVDRVTLWFVPAILVLALATVLGWLAFGPDPKVSHALTAGVAVLIIACPCAMGLATPTSIMVGTGRAAGLGVLFRQGDALQLLRDVDVIAFDKTGTITVGEPILTAFEVFDGFDEGEVLRLAASLEGASEHPVAKAVVARADEAGLSLGQVAEFAAIPGRGIAGRVEDRDVVIGTRKLMEERGINVVDRAGILIAVDGRVAAKMEVRDAIRATSARAVADLKARGHEIALITGDAQEAADVIAAEAGIARVIAGVDPVGKVAALNELRAGGRRVAFVGDGINDAPVLAEADVGIALGTGTDVAIESADVVLMSGDPGAVVNAVEVSDRTMRNIHQNLFWAFAYNVALVPVAAGLLYPFFGILLSPMLAGGAMALSSLFVVGNALRLRGIRPVHEVSKDATDAAGAGFGMRQAA
ncbi:heavy metal translocating P-type ATPase [Amaricoccus tamworthensis]|uniref:heavy metal translocating P-type ATPase n=1 Tax=Amaricoccus tamworthensis TaxID=57002 RepID=UPI003C7B5E2D